MAHCPKCGKKLRMTHWRPECPFCGVNMIYYNSNERILEETESAEIEHALKQPGVDRAKAAFFGSAPAIARLVLSVLPIGALFLPLAKAVFGGEKVTVNAIKLVTFIKDRGFGAIVSDALKISPLSLAALLTALAAVIIIVRVACLPASLGKHGKTRNLILDLLDLALACGAAAIFVTGAARSPEIALSSPSLGAGFFVFAGLIAAAAVFNLVLAKKGLKVNYTTCFIGGIPSDEYFDMKERGLSELEIKKEMVKRLTVMQDEVRAKAAREEEEALQKRASHK